MIESAFKHPLLLQTLRDMGVSELSPLLQLALPKFSAGEHLLIEAFEYQAKAPSDFDKALLFILPVVDQLLLKQQDPQKALILVPSNALVKQLTQLCQLLLKPLGLQLESTQGKVDKFANKAEFDLMIATPSRLLEMHGLHPLPLAQIHCCVIDEIGQMFDNDFANDLLAIDDEVHPQCQRVLISNKFANQDVHDFMQTWIGDEAQYETVGINPVDEAVEHHAIAIKQHSEKTSHTISVLKQHGERKVLIFVNTVKASLNLAFALKEANISAQVLHERLSSAERNQVLQDCQSDDKEVYICTELSARAIKQQQFDMIVNFTFPRTRIDYVERLRYLGGQGTVVNMVEHMQWLLMDSIERKLDLTLVRS